MQPTRRRSEMVQTSSSAPGAAGGAPAADQPGSVRNVVLVGHSGAGKTSLVEALLVATGTVSRAGRVEDGTTVTRLRRGRAPPAAVDLPRARTGRARRGEGQPAGHPRLRGLRRRPPGRPARRGRRPVRRVRRRRRRRRHPHPLGGVRRGRHAARRGHHQARQGPRRLRRGGRDLPADVRRRRAPAVPADGRRRRQSRRADRAALAHRGRPLQRRPGSSASPTPSTWR